MGDTEVFYKNGFSAVIFSTVMERSVVGNIFRINEEKIEEELAKYTKLVSSDLLLLHLPGCIFTAIRDKSFIDFIVEYSMKEFKLEESFEAERMTGLLGNTETMDAQAESIYQKVMELFG